MIAIRSVKRWDDLALAILAACEIDSQYVDGLTFTHRVGSMPSVVVEYNAPAVGSSVAVGRCSVKFVPEEKP